MKYFIILFSILVIVHLKSIGQFSESLLKTYNDQTLYHSGTMFMKGTQKLSYRDIRLEFNSTATKNLYQKSQNKLVLSRIFNIASLGLAIFSTLTKTNTAGAIELAVGTGVLGLGGIYFHNQSSKYLDKVIWLRNKEVLFNVNH